MGMPAVRQSVVLLGTRIVDTVDPLCPHVLHPDLISCKSGVIRPVLVTRSELNVYRFFFSLIRTGQVFVQY